MSIAGWRAGIVKAVRQFYPDGEAMMISKYPKGPFLTDYPSIDRGCKTFLMDSYPMEGSRKWELLRWLCDLEVYQSAAEHQGQAIVAHLQAYDNSSWSPAPCRAAWPEEFAQQHLAMIARGVGATVSWGFAHVVRLAPHGKQQGLLPQATVDDIVRRRHAVMERVQQASRGTVPYRKGVLLRYNPLENCNPHGAAAVYARYKSWKDRGTPVSLVWDDKQAGETVPEQFEFLLEGDARDTDMAIRAGECSYLVTLINLRDEPRDLHLRVCLKGEDMARYVASRIDEPGPITVERAGGNLYCGMHLPPLACTVT